MAKILVKFINVTEQNMTKPGNLKIY